jgi:hypothetical protein
MTTRIYLSGGLGNQLFQLAAALFVSNGGDVVLESRYSHTRKNRQGEPDICGFELPGNVSISQIEGNQLVRRFLNLGIRLGAKESSLFLLKTLEIVIAVLMFLIEGKLLRVFINRGLGYDPRIVGVRKNAFLVGYFQTHKLVDKVEVFSSMKAMGLAEGLATENLPLNPEKQIYLHLRLGDYLEAASFGIPSVSYYQNAISEMRSFRQDLNLVIFSDEPLKVKTYLRQILTDQDLILAPSTHSAAEVLQSYRSGKYYVIGNSSFSWWGAYLSLNDQSRVAAPTPWFLMATSPSNLIPPSWIELTSF